METSILDELKDLKTQHKEFIAKRGERTKDRDLAICNLRYKDGLTLQAIGTRYGLTRERVRQIIDKTLQ